MGLITRLLGKRSRTETWQRTSAEDPDTVFYAREWLCKTASRREEVATVLELRSPKPAGWVDGILEVDATEKKVLVVEYEGATFAFAQRVGAPDLAARLATPSGSAYAVHLDDKRRSFQCTRAVDGQLARQLAFTDGVFSEQGLRDPAEPAIPNDGSSPPLSQTRVLELAATWGPDPRALVRAAPTGWLYLRG